MPSAYPVLRPSGNSLGPNTGYGSNPNGGVYGAGNSYVEQWNFGLQRELPDAFLLGVFYAGARGVKLPIDYNANDVNPALYYPVGNAAGVTALEKQYPNPFYGLIHTGSLANPTISAQALNAQVSAIQHAPDAIYAVGLFSLQLAAGKSVAEFSSRVLDAAGVYVVEEFGRRE